MISSRLKKSQYTPKGQLCSPPAGEGFTDDLKQGRLGEGYEPLPLALAAYRERISSFLLVEVLGVLKGHG